VLTTVGDTAGTLTHDVVGTIAPIEAVVQPVLTTVGDTAGTLTHHVSHPTDVGNLVSDALPSPAPVVHTTEPVTTTTAALSNPTSDVSDPADTLLSLATATNAPIEVSGSPMAAPVDTAAVHPTTIGGDVIALNDAPPPPTHALFTGTQYTHYGVTLSSDVAVPPQHAVSLADTTSAHDTLVPVAADAQGHAPPPPDIMDTTHTIDHLGHAMP
jgi:hypothetical protein